MWLSTTDLPLLLHIQTVDQCDCWRNYVRWHCMSCTVALHSNLGLGLFNLAPTSISILCRPSPIVAFQHTLSILASCIYPSSCGPSTGLVPSVYPFSSFFGALSSFILNMWSTHWSLLNLIFLVSSMALYMND